MKTNILFVCYANVCRSPMAEYLLRAKGSDGVNVASCGLLEPATLRDKGAPEESQQAMKEIGIDISGHKPKIITPYLLSSASIVLAMDREVKKEMQESGLWDEEKCYLAREFAFGEMKDIEDPYCGTVKDFRKCRDFLSKTINKIAEKIRSFNGA